jgi:hypothetical protein
MLCALPVSNLSVELRPPTGLEDVLLQESAQADRRLAVELLRRLSSVSEPEALTLHDFEVLLLRLHVFEFGDLVDSDAECSCGHRVDIRFQVSAYVSERTPRMPRGVTRGSDSGWFALAGASAEFRLPTVSDQIAVSHEKDAVEALAARCLRPARSSARLERAMAALAPLLSDRVQGQCPYCKESLIFYFDVPSFVMRELRLRAGGIYDEVHLLAKHYHWTEAHILGLPRARRRRYAERLHAEQERN